jgi:hypothetical protein
MWWMSQLHVVQVEDVPQNHRRGSAHDRQMYQCPWSRFTHFILCRLGSLHKASHCFIPASKYWGVNHTRGSRSLKNLRPGLETLHRTKKRLCATTVQSTTRHSGSYLITLANCMKQRNSWGYDTKFLPRFWPKCLYGVYGNQPIALISKQANQVHIFAAYFL